MGPSDSAVAACVMEPTGADNERGQLWRRGQAERVEASGEGLGVGAQVGWRCCFSGQAAWLDSGDYEGDVPSDSAVAACVMEPTTSEASWSATGADAQSRQRAKRVGRRQE